MIVCLLLALSLLAGCLKDEVGGVRLSSDGPVEMYSVPRQVAVMLFHTGGAWTATTDATWLKVKKESGTGGHGHAHHRHYGEEPDWGSAHGSGGSAA